MPTNVPELRRVIGMINYLGRFIPNLAAEIHPMTELLKSDRVWTWGHSQQEAFTKVKEKLSSSTVLAFYDSKKPTVVCADASSYGIGGVLMQDYNNQLSCCFVPEHSPRRKSNMLKLRRSVWQPCGHVRD